jgi:hypothetical protein
MEIALGTMVTLPGFTPYPRYGRVTAILDSGEAVVAHVHCGDPRCSAEHAHGTQTWPTATLEATTAYQPRAAWEHGRKGAPNASLI